MSESFCLPTDNSRIYFEFAEFVEVRKASEDLKIHAPERKQLEHSLSIFRSSEDGIKA